MKTKRDPRSSSEDSEESVDHQSSSSDSESEESSASEHRHRKKKKRARSSDSDSDTEGQRRAKKRKHKKKKKKHVKRKRRSESDAKSESEAEDAVSLSEEEDSQKRKYKKHHKHKRSRSSSHSEEEEDRKERRLHSVVKERRLSEDGERAPASYYQYRPPSPAPFVEEREREVMRFYRGSSKERRYQEQYPYEQERNGRYGQDNYAKNANPSTQYIPPLMALDVKPCDLGSDTRQNDPRKQRDYTKVQKYQQRNPRYEGNKPLGEYRGRPREDYQPREDTRGYNRNYNQYEDRQKRGYEEGRDYRERRGPPEPYRDQRDYPERRDRYREEPYQADRSRDVRREKPPPARTERPQHHGEERYERSKPRDDKNGSDRYRDPRDERRGPRTEDRRPEDHRPDDRRPDDRRPEDRRPDDRRPEDRRPDDRRPEDRRPEDRRPEERKSNERKPEERSSNDDRRPTDRTRSEVKAEPRGRDKKTRFGDADEKDHAWGKDGDKKEGKPEADKEKPNFGLSGKLTADANTVNGVVVKYTEPDDAKQPKRRWRFYPFKGDKALPILYIHRQSGFLIGRDKKVCDITLDHPSISKQHCALQYRATPFTREDGTQGRRVRPYIIDLESANGTFVNNKKIDPRRYVELLERDVVKFGFSERDYVLLHENSKDEAQDDDEPAAVTTTAQLKMEKHIKSEITEDGH